MNSGSSPSSSVSGLASSAALTSTTVRSVGLRGNHSFTSHNLQALVLSSVLRATLQTALTLLFASSVMHRVRRA